jgi:sugar lactone lactonase YvrE
MLGGDERRTLFIMTAPSSMPDIVSTSRQGHVACAVVQTPGGGWP